jgi:hypothetical protein
MKVWWNVIIQVTNVALVAFQPQIGGWLTHHPGVTTAVAGIVGIIPGVTTAVAGIVGIIAHFYRPDGTPVNGGGGK